MKALILDGSRPGDAAAEIVRGAAGVELSALGWRVEVLTLSRMQIGTCTGCFGCWTRTPGICVQDDDGREVARKAALSDLLVLLTPVTFGGYSSVLKRGMDRLPSNLSPFFTRIGGEVHHKPRYPRVPRLLGLGLSPTAEEEEACLFRTLVARNAINMHSPGNAAGVFVGATPEDAPAGVRALLQEAGVTR